MKFRIKQNKQNTFVQKKWGIFWLTASMFYDNGPMEFDIMEDGYNFCSIEHAKKCIEKYKAYKKEQDKKKTIEKSKYEIINLPEETPLYKVLNK